MVLLHVYTVWSNEIQSIIWEYRKDPAHTGIKVMAVWTESFWCIMMFHTQTYWNTLSCVGTILLSMRWTQQGYKMLLTQTWWFAHSPVKMHYAVWEPSFWGCVSHSKDACHTEKDSSHRNPCFQHATHRTSLQAAVHCSFEMHQTSSWDMQSKLCRESRYDYSVPPVRTWGDWPSLVERELYGLCSSTDRMITISSPN